MKILFYRYGSICEPDIIEAMKHLGHEVFCINLEITDKNIPTQTVIKHVSDTLLSSSFDCIFSINFYPVLSEICNIMKLPYICWTVDSPVMELYSDSYSNEWNRIFLFDSMQYKDFAPILIKVIFPLLDRSIRKNVLMMPSRILPLISKDI